MTIKVYQSLVASEPIESNEWAGKFSEWLDSKEANYRAWEVPPTVLVVNGVEIPFSDWEETQLSADDNVEVRYVQHGGVFKALGSIVGKVFNFAFGWLLPSNKAPNRYDTPQGKQLEAAMGTANQAKLGDVVPEIAGRHRRYPDYLTPPRRYFASPREQRLEFLACIGVGRYQINDADVKVGDTPISSLGADGSYQIFEPNANLSVVATHQHWHTVDEVGGTSSGTAGLELSTEYANRANSDPAFYTFNGNTITRASGEFPSGWGNGTVVTIELSRTNSYDVERALGVFGPSVFTGDFGHLTPLSNGSRIRVTGGNSPLGNITYIAQQVDLDANGVGSLQLWTVPIPPTEYDEGTPSSPVSIADGTYNITTEVTHERTLTTVASDSLTYSGGIINAGAGPAAIVYKSGPIYGEWTSEFVVTPGNEVTSTLELDFFFPNGLAYIEDDGRLSSRSVQVEFQYRYLANNNTVSVFRTYNQSSLDQIGFTERINIAQGAVACRARRIGSSSTSTQVNDTVHWYGLKCRLPTRTRYPDWTTISVQLRSGGRIAAQSENQINVVATRILPILQSNGTWTPPQPTRDISAFVRYIAEFIGYTLDDIDMPELLRLHNIWKGRGETIDNVFELTTVKDALATVLAAGMSELTIADGLIRPVRDGIRTQFEDGYSPQNMTAALRRTFRAARHDDADGVEVEYIDNETWTRETVICALPGSPQIKLEKLTLKGAFSRARAWRIGMRRARQIAYQNWEYSFDTEMDALNSEYLSYVPLLDDIPGYGQSALLINAEAAGSNVILTVSEEIQWQDGKDHVVAYRKVDGTLAGPWTATKVGDFMIQALIPVAERPKVSLKMELPHVYIGTTEEWCFPALITEISPRGTDSVSVSAVNYDARIYADDDNYPSN